MSLQIILSILLYTINYLYIHSSYTIASKLKLASSYKMKIFNQHLIIDFVGVSFTLYLNVQINWTWYIWIYVVWKKVLHTFTLFPRHHFWFRNLCFGVRRHTFTNLSIIQFNIFKIINWYDTLWCEAQKLHSSVEHTVSFIVHGMQKSHAT